jgi:hypothetical protein
MSIIAEKNNVKFTYSVYHSKLKELGIHFFETGTMIYGQGVHVTSDNALPLITGPPIYKSLIMLPSTYFQTSALSLFLRNYFRSAPIRASIESHNRFAPRYNNNNDAFVHVRLGDITGTVHTLPLSYYENALSGIDFSGGYISSDSPDHEICKTLSEKYGLTIFNEDEVSTIMLASTCKHLVLSHGTYSWVIGVLGYYSDVYNPDFTAAWHGDIFNMPGWKKVVCAT